MYSAVDGMPTVSRSKWRINERRFLSSIVCINKQKGEKKKLKGSYCLLFN